MESGLKGRVCGVKRGPVTLCAEQNIAVSQENRNYSGRQSVREQRRGIVHLSSSVPSSRARASSSGNGLGKIGRGG